MRKQYHKRLISMLLAVCMIVGMMPGMAMAGGTDPVELVFDFSKAYQDRQGTMDEAKAITYAMTTKGSSSEMNTSITTEPWEFHSTTAAGGNNYVMYLQLTGIEGLYLKRKSNYQLKLKVNTAGTYTPSVEISRYTSGPGAVSLYQYDAANDTVGDLICTKTVPIDTTQNVTAPIADKPLHLDAGEYILRVEVTEGTKDQSCVINKLILGGSTDPVTLNFDFSKAYQGRQGTMDEAKAITYEMTTKGSGSEMNTSIATEPWEFHSTTAAGGNNFVMYLQLTGIEGLYLKRKSNYQLKLKVNTAGDYRPYIEVSRYTSGPGAVSLYQYDAANDTVGTLLCTMTVPIDATQNATSPIADAPIHLDAGEYILRVEVTEGTKDQSCVINKLILKSGAELFADMADAGGVVTLKKGASANIPLNLSYSDGSEVDYTALTVSPSFTAAGIATADVSKTAGGVSLTVNGLAEGLTTMSVAISDKDGGSATAKVNVKVLTEDEKPRDLYYDFMKGWTGVVLADSMTKLTYAHITKDSISEINPSIASDPWAFFSTNVTGGNNYFGYITKDYGVALQQKGYGAIRIKVPFSGKFTPQVTPYTGGLTTNATLRFYKLEDGKIVGDPLFVKQVMAEGSIKAYDLTDEPLELTAGEYVFHITNDTDRNIDNTDRQRTTINAFGLKYYNPLSISADAPTVYLGTDALVPFAVKLDGVDVALADLTVFEVKSSDESIFTVKSADADGIVLSGVNAGSAALEIRAEYSGEKVTKVLDVTVKEPAVEIQAAVSTIYIDNDTTVPVNFSKGGSAIAFSELTDAKAVSSESGTFTVKSFTADGVTLTGVKAGTAKLTISANYKGETVSAVYDVTVRAADFIYDMRKLFRSYKPASIDITDLNDWEYTTMGSSREVNKGTTYSDWTDPFIYDSQDPAANLRCGEAVYGLIMNDGWGRIRIRVPVSGVYSFTTNYPAYASGGIAETYLAPVGAEDPMAAKYYIGTQDTYGKNIWEYENHLRNVTLTAGDYYVTVKDIGKNPSSGGKYIMIGHFRLTTPGEKEVYMYADNPGRAVKDSKIMIPLHPTIDGAETNFASATALTAKSGDESILTAAIKKNADNTAVVEVTGVKIGDATVTVSTTIDGKTATVEIPLTVVEATALDYMELLTDKDELEAGESASLTLNAYQMNGELMDVAALTPYYVSSAPTVLAVDADGKLTAKSKGTAEITAYVEIDGILRKSSVTVTVTTDPMKTSAAISAPGMIDIGDSAELIVVGSLATGGSYSTTSASFEIVSVTPAGAATLSGNKLTAVAQGTVTVKATIPASGEQAELVSAPVTIDLTKPEEEPDGDPSEIYINLRDPKTQATPILGHTTSASGWALNQTMTPEAVYNDAAIAGKRFRYQAYGIGAQYTDKYSEEYNADITFDVNVKNSGNYEMFVDGGLYAAGAKVAVYVDKQYVGEYDFYSTANILQGPSVQMNTVSLKKGIHQVTFRRISPESNHCYLYLGSIRFTPVASMPTWDGFKLEAEQNILALGESCGIKAGGYMADGSPCNFGNLFAGNAEDKDNYAKVSVAGGAVKIENGRLVAAAVGESTITLNGKYKGAESTKTLTVQVDDQAIGSVTATLEKSALTAGESCLVQITAKTESGRALNASSVTTQITPDQAGIVTVDGNTITAAGNGTVNLTVSATFNGKTVSTSVPVTVSGVPTTLMLTADTTVMKPSDAKGAQISAQLVSGDGGNKIDMTGAAISYRSLNENTISVDATGHVMPIAVGKAEVEVTVTLKGETFVNTILFNITVGKTAASYYTPERVAALRENAKTYSWANTGMESVIRKADAYLAKNIDYSSFITTQELPRAAAIGYRYDPNMYLCRYCGVDLRAEYSAYGWIMDPIAEPFKVQCPDCRRKFPSNDFEKFYELGINEKGDWSYELAKEKNAELVANGQDGYLKNVLYPEKGEGWGVDDGYGYRTGKMIPGTDGKQQEETHTYIAYYNHWGVWYDYGNMDHGGIVQDVAETMRDAYLYSGDKKYGRVLANIVDRVADVYPDMFIEPYFPRFFNSDSTSPRGKMVGCIWQHGLTRTFIRGYDAAYDVYDDAQLMQTIGARAEKWQLRSEKNNPTEVRQHIEDNLLRENFKALKTADVHGNFGMHQSSAAYTGVVLDTMPETGEIIDWMFNSSTDNFYTTPDAEGTRVHGGNVTAHIINNVDRDGHGAESAPNYNFLWLGGVMAIADVLAGYKTYEAGDLYQNPIFMKMFKAYAPITLTRRATAQIGDSGATGKDGFIIGAASLLKGFQFSGDPELAQFAYAINGNTVEGLHYDSYTQDPNKAQQDVMAVIEKYGEYDFDRSQQLAGYGFSILRDGGLYRTSDTANTVDTQRDFWIYHGAANSHKHADVLNLGIEAYGINIAPDLGYPEAADGAEKNVVWGQGTINHNTVMVNDQGHNRIRSYTNGTPRMNSNPLHFDDSGRVKLMDIDAPPATTNGTASGGIFRRTLVMIRVNDEISYGVDFFRVKGGNEHLYNFHAMSDEIYETENLSLVPQKMGSYAGPEIPFETKGYSNGFTYLKNVRRASYPGGEVAVDFKIKDFRKQLTRDMDLHLRMTMLNDFDLSEVAIASGAPPQRDNNPESLEFVLARRSGKNLDSLFTTVYEPYNGERYVENMEQVAITRIGGAKPGAVDTAKAIKVELTNGNTDYIVYASNNQVKYRVDDLFDFQGFVGVYTLKDGEVVYAYGNDASLVGDMTATPAYTGKVIDFTREIAVENELTVRFDQKIDESQLIGKFINVKNGLTENAAYEIQGVTAAGEGKYVLDVGDTRFITSTKDANDLSAGYNYLVAEGDSFTIPLPAVSETVPVFREIPDQSVEAGSELKFQVSAESPNGRALTYSANTLPRGAQFDEQAQTFSWIPDGSQVGENVAAFDVTDGIFTETMYVKIKVYHSASGGGTSSITNTPGNSTTEKPIQPEKPVVTVEKDEVSFAAGTNETTAETKLGTVTFADGTFAADGQGKLKIERENETYTVSVTATVDMEQKPAKVSLNYKPADNMADENCIIVKDANGNIIPNGRYENGKMTFYTDTFGEFTIEYNPKSFTDLGNHAWASGAITRLAARGIINGITATTYGPARNITRADFTTLIVRAFGFTAETASFADVPANAYYAEPVGIAKTLGIVGGVNESDFAPTSEITRQDMMVIVARALEKAGYVLDASENPEFSDIDEVADYAKDAVEILTKSGLIAGSNGKINPKGNTTRAEVAVILDRIVFMQK